MEPILLDVCPDAAQVQLLRLARVHGCAVQDHNLVGELAQELDARLHSRHVRHSRAVQRSKTGFHSYSTHQPIPSKLDIELSRTSILAYAISLVLSWLKNYTQIVSLYIKDAVPDNHGLALFGGVLQEREVGEIGRSHLEEWDANLVQEVHALLIPPRRGEEDLLLVCVVLELCVGGWVRSNTRSGVHGIDYINVIG